MKSCISPDPSPDSCSGITFVRNERAYHFYEEEGERGALASKMIHLSSTKNSRGCEFIFEYSDYERNFLHERMLSRILLYFYFIRYFLEVFLKLNLKEGAERAGRDPSLSVVSE